jgi:hypothetical protein
MQEKELNENNVLWLQNVKRRENQGKLDAACIVRHATELKGAWCEYVDRVYLAQVKEQWQ